MAANDAEYAAAAQRQELKDAGYAVDMDYEELEDTGYAADAHYEDSGSAFPAAGAHYEGSENAGYAAGAHDEELEDADVEAANDPGQSTAARYDHFAGAKLKATTAAENEESAEVDSDATIDPEDEEMAEAGLEATIDAENKEMVETSVEPPMKLKDLSIHLMERYPAITKRKYRTSYLHYKTDMTSVIHGRPSAEKYETIMAAVTQIMAMFSFIKKDPSYLYFPTRTKREDEETAMEELNDEINLTPVIIAVLEEVWNLWDITIKYALHINVHVFDKGHYGLPKATPWIEFVAIAALIAKHREIYANKFYKGEDGDKGVYPVMVILQDISRLRRWLRSHLNPAGYRRNNKDWQECWYIINRDRDDKDLVLEIPDRSRFKDPEKGGPFVFAAEPKLEIEYE